LNWIIGFLIQIFMISIEKCRELIPGSDKMSDEEIWQLRKELYEVAGLALEVYFVEKNPDDTDGISGNI
jgi:hypothetical protein